MDRWSIFDNAQVEAEMEMGTVCATEGCFNLACVAGRCVGFDCLSAWCEECLAKSDLKFHCRKCRNISTGGIACISTSPSKLLYYMLSIVDENTARRYLRSEDGSSYTLGESDELRISTFSRIRGTDTFGATKFCSPKKYYLRVLKCQLTALSRRDLRDGDDRFQVFVPKISVVEKQILTKFGKIKKKPMCKIIKLI